MTVEPLYDLSGLLMLNDVVNRIVEDAKGPYGPEGCIWAGGNEVSLLNANRGVIRDNDRGLVRVSYRLLGMLPPAELRTASIRPVALDAAAFMTSAALSNRLRLIMSKVDRLPK